MWELFNWKSNLTSFPLIKFDTGPFYVSVEIRETTGNNFRASFDLCPEMMFEMLKRIVAHRANYSPELMQALLQVEAMFAKPGGG